MSLAIKKYFAYLKESVPEIGKTIVAFLLVGSGIIVTALLYSQNLDGVTILTAGCLVEIPALLVLRYLAPRGFFYQKEVEEGGDEKEEDLKKIRRK
ncbi:MAG: hypothetical protein ACTSU5_12245 [Promethearchaeota archaeon]